MKIGGERSSTNPQDSGFGRANEDLSCKSAAERARRGGPQDGGRSILSQAQQPQQPQQTKSPPPKHTHCVKVNLPAYLLFREGIVALQYLQGTALFFWLGFTTWALRHLGHTLLRLSIPSIIAEKM